MVVGSGSASFFLPRDMTLLTALTSRKMISAMIRKLITAVMNLPYAMWAPLISSTKSLKSMPPKIPRIGEMMSSVSEVTIAPNAPPMITPTARSMTLPRMMNSLNSFTIFI